jgi:hypothetical protein
MRHAAAVALVAVLVAAIVAGCGGSKGGVPGLDDVRACLAKDDHFSSFFDGATPPADFALGSLPDEIRRRSLVALVDRVGAGPRTRGSRQGVVLALLREDDASLARRWSTYLRVHAIAGNRGGLKPVEGDSYGWVVGRIRPVRRVTGERARWVRTWGRTQQYAYRVLIVCFGGVPPVGFPPLPKA